MLILNSTFIFIFSLLLGNSFLFSFGCSFYLLFFNFFLSFLAYNISQYFLSQMHLGRHLSSAHKWNFGLWDFEYFFDCIFLLWLRSIISYCYQPTHLATKCQSQQFISKHLHFNFIWLLMIIYYSWSFSTCQWLRFSRFNKAIFYYQHWIRLLVYGWWGQFSCFDDLGVTGQDPTLLESFYCIFDLWSSSSHWDTLMNKYLSNNSPRFFMSQVPIIFTAFIKMRSNACIRCIAFRNKTK